MILEADEEAWCTLTAEANNRVLGRRLGNKIGDVKKELAKLDTHALWPLLEVVMCNAHSSAFGGRSRDLASVLSRRHRPRCLPHCPSLIIRMLC